MAAQADLLARWDNRCAYCRLPFGLLIWRSSTRLGRLSARGYFNATKHAGTALTLHWDHFTPFTYSESCADDQFLPACNLCNALKADKVFRSVEGAREYLEPLWLRRYELASGPVSSWREAIELELRDYVAV